MHVCSSAIWITPIKVSLSVTGLIHKLAQSFNAMEALRAMRGGRNWPRVDYLATNAVSELRQVLRTEGPVEMQLQQLLESSEIDLEAVCSRLRDLMWTHPGYRHLAEIVTLSDAQIMSMWEENRRTAASRGTWTHALCECLLNGGSVPVDSAEICMFFKFLRGFQSEGWTIHRTEWTVYAEAEDLAGSIDAVAQRGFGDLSFGLETHQAIGIEGLQLRTQTSLSAGGHRGLCPVALPHPIQYLRMDSSTLLRPLQTSESSVCIPTTTSSLWSSQCQSCQTAWTS